MASRGPGTEGLVGRWAEPTQSPQCTCQRSAASRLLAHPTPIHPSEPESDAPSAGQPPTELGLSEDKAEEP